MTHITFTATDSQLATLTEMIESGRAKSIADAIRIGINLLAREEALESIRRGRQEIREGKCLSGDLNELVKLVD